ncbi:hypothetical protein HNQ91_001049 [Filimonas zeae]|uniref:Uncharacterized protein n=1 Tax=Filimonas zeae TaxID=1737353 RepID=A0A917ISH1_9BACT|nr:hypothetical protein [Filimonas zeae]MDR6338027.1 hypothetical protein [Filimonas zeae]GGH61361.1 hypothetical protein GCM10011379_10260 [Filimonas zeae]
MIRTIALLAFVSVLAVTPACKTAQTSTINSVHYDEQKNNTVLILLPYGNITLPGKWKDQGENSVSRQHYFSNEDSTTNIAVTKNPRRFYPFNQKQDSDQEFTHHFVAWDTAYFHETGRPTQIITDSSATTGFVLFDVSHPQSQSPKTTFLYGTKNGICYNLSGNSRKLTQAEFQAFLIRLFYDN